MTLERNYQFSKSKKMTTTTEAIVKEYEKAKTMKAIGLTQKPKIGNVPNEIQELDIPIPKVNDTDVLVRIFASVLHVDEIGIAQGTALGRFYGPKEVSKEKPFVMGANFSGVIVAKGKQITQFNIGDEVIGIPNEQGENGSWATYRNLDQKHIRLKPKELSHKEVVAMLVAGCVAFGMTLYSKVKEGDQCLVLGASGGIGMTVTQMLKAKGAIVTGLCSTRNIEAVKANGADFIIDYKKEQFSQKLINEQKTMDLVFDSVGGKKIEDESLRILKKNGKYITVCGPEQYIGSKRLSWGKVIGIMWYIFQRSILSKIKGPRYIFPLKYPSIIIDEMLEFVIQHNIRVPFDRVVLLKQKQMSEALRHLASHKATGRIVIDLTKNE